MSISNSINAVSISWADVEQKFYARYDRVYGSNQAKAHLDSCGKMIDNAKQRWKEVILLDAIICHIDNSAVSPCRTTTTSTSRFGPVLKLANRELQFDQHRELCFSIHECVQTNGFDRSKSDQDNIILTLATTSDPLHMSYATTVSRTDGSMNKVDNIMLHVSNNGPQQHATKFGLTNIQLAWQNVYNLKDYLFGGISAAPNSNRSLNAKRRAEIVDDMLMHCKPLLTQYFPTLADAVFKCVCDIISAPPLQPIPTDTHYQEVCQQVASELPMDGNIVKNMPVPTAAGVHTARRSQTAHVAPLTASNITSDVTTTIPKPPYVRIPTRMSSSRALSKSNSVNASHMTVTPTAEFLTSRSNALTGAQSVSLSNAQTSAYQTAERLQLFHGLDPAYFPDSFHPNKVSSSARAFPPASTTTVAQPQHSRIPMNVAAGMQDNRELLAEFNQHLAVVNASRGLHSQNLQAMARQHALNLPPTESFALPSNCPGDPSGQSLDVEHYQQYMRHCHQAYVHYVSYVALMPFGLPPPPFYPPHPGSYYPTPPQQTTMSANHRPTSNVSHRTGVPSHDIGLTARYYDVDTSFRPRQQQQQQQQRMYRSQDNTSDFVENSPTQSPPMNDHLLNHNYVNRQTESSSVVSHQSDLSDQLLQQQRNHANSSLPTVLGSVTTASLNSIEQGEKSDAVDVAGLLDNAMGSSLLTPNGSIGENDVSNRLTPTRRRSDVRENDDTAISQRRVSRTAVDSVPQSRPAKRKRTARNVKVTKTAQSSDVESDSNNTSDGYSVHESPPQRHKGVKAKSRHSTRAASASPSVTSLHSSSDVDINELRSEKLRATHTNTSKRNEKFKSVPVHALLGNVSAASSPIITDTAVNRVASGGAKAKPKRMNSFDFYQKNGGEYNQAAIMPTAIVAKTVSAVLVPSSNGDQQQLVALSRNETGRRSSRGRQ